MSRIEKRRYNRVGDIILYAMLAMLIILVINLLETCSWTEYKGHLNYIHNYKNPCTHD